MLESKKEKIRVDYISQREFAKRIGVNHTSVMAAINNGEITEGVYIHPNNGHRKIIYDIALKEWELTRSDDPRSIANRENGKKNKGRKKTDKKKEDSSNSGRETLQETRIQKQRIEIAEKALKLKRLKGDLVDKETVYSELFSFGKLMRDTIMAIPDRIIDRVLASEDRNEAHTLLSDELRAALSQLSNVESLDLSEK